MIKFYKNQALVFSNIFNHFRWSQQRSGTDSETEGEDGSSVVQRDNGVSAGHHGPDLGSSSERFIGGQGQVSSPQLTLAEFLQK